MLSTGQINIKMLFNFVDGVYLSFEEFDLKYKVCWLDFIQVSTDDILHLFLTKTL
jgi:hypothetical protein